MRNTQARIQDFGNGGGAWGVGDKLAVRSSQVCAPGGSEGMPPRNFWNFRCIFLQFGAYFIKKIIFLPIFCRWKGGRAPPRPPAWIRAWDYFPFNEVAGKSRSGSSIANCYCLERCVIFTLTSHHSQSDNEHNLDTWPKTHIPQSAENLSFLGHCHKFPEFSLIFCIFPNSLSFPWLENWKLIFKVLPDFRSGWEPCIYVLLVSWRIYSSIFFG